MAPGGEPDPHGSGSSSPATLPAPGRGPGLQQRRAPPVTRPVTGDVPRSWHAPRPPCSPRLPRLPRLPRSPRPPHARRRERPPRPVVSRSPGHPSARTVGRRSTVSAHGIGSDPVDPWTLTSGAGVARWRRMPRWGFWPVGRPTFRVAPAKRLESRHPHDTTPSRPVAIAPCQERWRRPEEPVAHPTWPALECPPERVDPARHGRLGPTRAVTPEPSRRGGAVRAAREDRDRAASVMARRAAGEDASTWVFAARCCRVS
jgi:hypothetical protein